MTEIPRQPRRRGRQDSTSGLWRRRRAALIREGFIPDEANSLAEGKIDTPTMRAGRRARVRWRRGIRAKFPKLTDAEYVDIVLEMYDTEDWDDPYSQFYFGEE